MASVELRPGDTLNIIWIAQQDTPLGTKEIESIFAFEYDDLLIKLRAKGRAGKSRKSGTNGARFSRVIALATNALKKGKWSTGADIDKDIVFNRLMKKFSELDKIEYANITANAKESLGNLFRNTKINFKPQQKKDLKAMLDNIGIPN